MSIPGIRFITSNTPGSGNGVGIGLSAIRGPTGPPGAFGGPQGLVGVQGNQGYQGLIGLQGLLGPTGAPGTIGINGVQGSTGSIGPQGGAGMGFVVFANTTSYTGLNTVIATGGNIGQFVLVLGGDLFVYAGTGSGYTGPNNSYGYAGDVTDESKLVGLQGNVGSQGPIGINGLQGATGAQGLQGLVGSTGSIGLQGLIGATGSIGLQGLIGQTGSIGLQGLIGSTGSIGLQGLVGSTGSIGLQGATGAIGLQGLIGSTGSIGLQGLIGATGSIGLQGLVGSTGAIGPAGYNAVATYNYRYSSTTTFGNPGQGLFRLGNSNMGIATGMYINSTDGAGLGNDLGRVFGDLNTYGAPGKRGFLKIQKAEDYTWYFVYEIQNITQQATGATGWYSFDLNCILPDANFTNNDDVYLSLIPAGPPGPTGSIGLQGLAGSTGSIGPQGLIGSTGGIGLQGPTGSKGNDGLTGLQGSTGSIGLQGLQGSTGDIGLTGLQGATGSIGPQGGAGMGFVVFANTTSYTGLNTVIATGGNIGQFVLVLGGDLFVYAGTGSGYTGPDNSYGYAGDVTDESKLYGTQGPVGLQGYQGSTGLQGIMGIQGYQGETGMQGYQGYQGHTGLQGYQGYQGHTGLQGYQGHTGLQGYQGHTGLQGYQGIPGPVAGQSSQFIFNQSGAATGSNNALTYLETSTGGLIYAGSSIIPSQDSVFNLGSPDNLWKSIYISTGTIFIGPTGTLGLNNNGIISSSEGFATPFITVGSTDPGAGIKLYNQNNILWFIDQFGASGPVAIWKVAQNSVNNMFFTGGNIGVGTSTPVYPLEVKGTVSSEKLIATNGVSFNTNATARKYYSVTTVYTGTNSPLDIQLTFTNYSFKANVTAFIQNKNRVNDLSTYTNTYVGGSYDGSTPSNNIVSFGPSILNNPSTAYTFTGPASITTPTVVRLVSSESILSSNSVVYSISAEVIKGTLSSINDGVNPITTFNY